MISHPFLLFTQKGGLQPAPTVHTERGGGKGSKGASVYYREGTMADERGSLGLVHFILWRAEGCPVGIPGLAFTSILIPTHRYPLFTIILSSDTLCASLFA